MKEMPAEDALRRKMQPGAISGGGFLGSDARSLQDILDTDAAAIAALGLTHLQVAERLGEIVRAAMAAQGAPAEVGTGLQAVYRESRGRVPCPWADGMFDKGQVEITDTRSGETLLCTPLSVHMIAAHGFYQGRGSCYRIEPGRLRRLMGLPSR